MPPRGSVANITETMAQLAGHRGTKGWDPLEEQDIRDLRAQLHEQRASHAP